VFFEVKLVGSFSKKRDVGVERGFKLPSLVHVHYFILTLVYLVLITSETILIKRFTKEWQVVEDSWVRRRF